MLFPNISMGGFSRIGDQVSQCTLYISHGIWSFSYFFTVSKRAREVPISSLLKFTHVELSCIYRRRDLMSALFPRRPLALLYKR